MYTDEELRSWWGELTPEQRAETIKVFGISGTNMLRQVLAQYRREQMSLHIWYMSKKDEWPRDPRENEKKSKEKSPGKLARWWQNFRSDSQKKPAKQAEAQVTAAQEEPDDDQSSTEEGAAPEIKSGNSGWTVAITLLVVFIGLPALVCMACSIIYFFAQFGLQSYP